MLELFAALIAVFDIVARPKRPLDIYNTTLIVSKRCIFVALHIFTVLIAVFYYIIEGPERSFGNYYYYPYSV